MSLSGDITGDLRPYTALQMIEEATSRAGIKPTALTSEVVEKSLDQMNLLFTQLLNRGLQLWKRQRMILPCYVNEAKVQLPVGVNIVSKLTRRTLSRQVGTPFTTGGGNSALAFDNDLTTSCVQVSVNGTLGCIFSSPQQITSVGVLFADAETLSYFVEYSLDGVTNWTALDAMTGSIAAGQWVWGDLNGSPAALGWRIRAVGTAPMSITELYFGTTPTEIPLDPWNLDEYNAMPNKTTPGPVLNWYQQRDLDSTYLLVWPVPATANAYDQLVVWVQEYLDTVSAPTQSLDVPRRWYDAITAMLARRLCRSLPEADLKRYDMLRAEEQEAVELAEGEERDPSNTNYDMGMGAYTA